MYMESNEEERQVGRMNEMVGEYLRHLGVSEEVNTEFTNKANGMRVVGAFNSEWFHDMTIRLSRILEEILQSQLANPNSRQSHLINEPPPSPPVVIEDEDEDEDGEGDGAGDGGQGNGPI